MSIPAKEIIVDVKHLKLGMHVLRLDRPLAETDFLFEDFVINSQKDIDDLLRQCQQVYVALEEENTEDRRRENRGLSARAAKVTKRAKKPAASAQDGDSRNSCEYEDSQTIEAELDLAASIYQSAKSTVKSILSDFRAGRVLDLKQARSSADAVVDSVLRNKCAMLWLTHIKARDEYTAEHCLNVCILSAAFARHLGYSESDIRLLALCGLLHDVGKSKIPETVLNKAGRLTDEEFLLMKKHTEFGSDLLADLPAAAVVVKNVAHSHHERMDGKGYPQGLVEDEIPLFAKIVCLADCYDAITSDRSYDRARASMEALDIIYKGKGAQFDRELSIEFIKCVGVYPPGSIVEISNGEVGIVLSTNKTNQLRPMVLLVRNEDQQESAEEIVDLNVMADMPARKGCAIARELPGGSYGIHIADYLSRIVAGVNTEHPEKGGDCE